MGVLPTTAGIEWYEWQSWPPTEYHYHYYTPLSEPGVVKAKINLIWDSNAGPEKGWVCPRCNCVFAPHVHECPHCNGSCASS
jgi:hypothetical protein